MLPCHKTIQCSVYYIEKKEEEKFLVRKKIGSIEDPIVSCFQVSEGLIKKMSSVLYICVGFWELSHSTLDLSQAEKKINVVTSYATDADKVTAIFIQNDNFDHFE